MASSLNDVLEKIQGKINGLEMLKGSYVADLRTKIERADWHGVCDCANDLRDIEAEQAMARQIMDEVISSKY